jgi:micrococcal nuclease
MPNPSRLLIILIILTLAVHSHANDVISGKVVGVSDGDTITVLENRTQNRIRLYGIDAPEDGQDFGNRAKKFVSDLVFGKQVRVVKMDIDRYDRVVGMVYVGDVNVNEALVKNGLAWVYQRYCKISICSSWLALEAQARAAKTGLWSHPNPVAPWEYRRNQRTSPQPVSDQRPGEIIYLGNRNSKVFHHPSCKDYNCKNCVIRFRSRQEAVRDGSFILKSW